nr:hypothetical protein [uncultured bacterium]
MDKKNLKDSIRRELKEAAKDIVRLGGWQDFRSGDWVFRLIERTFRRKSESAASESIFAKYPGHTHEQIAHKLIGAASKKAALAGAITGAAVSADELVALFTAGEAGVGLPANMAIAAIAICAEVFYTAKIQLEVVAELGNLYEIALDPDEPEDILTILNFALGGAIADLAGNRLMHMGPQFSKAVVGRYYAKKEAFETVKRLARKLSYRLVRRSVANAVVPGVSIFVGAMWNRRTTKIIGRTVVRHFSLRQQSANRTEPDAR